MRKENKRPETEIFSSTDRETISFFILYVWSKKARHMP